MDEPLNGAVQPDLLPRGVVVRYSGDDAADLWHRVVMLPGGDVGLALGHCPEPRDTDPGAVVDRALRETGDPRGALDALAPGTAAVCAVITPARRAMRYCTRAGSGPDPLVALARPKTPPESLGAAPAAPVRRDLSPGATLLLCSRADEPLTHVLVDVTGDPPQRGAERVAEALVATAAVDALVILYRSAPEPLDLRVPADPQSLAVVRDRMRRWLSLAGVDPEAMADALLAVGEAASNSSEHAVLGVSRPVHLTVRAAVDGDRLRFTVSDNGCWKPAATETDGTSHRGHGIRLINALVDAAEVTTDETGTTVEMLKELRP